MKVFAVVVTSNALKWYRIYFNSLKHSTLPVCIVIVDNISNEGIGAHLRENYPEINLIVLNRHVGSAKAFNIGIKYALAQGADYLFLLNQNVWVDKNTIAKLLETLHKQDNASIGIISPMQINGSYFGIDRNLKKFLPYQYFSDLYKEHPADIYYVDFINKAAYFIDVKCVKRVGGFDTSLFVEGGEEANYFQRIRFHGYDIAILSQCYVFCDIEEDEMNRKKKREHSLEIDEKTRLGDINYTIYIPLMIKELRRKFGQVLLSLNFFDCKKIICEWLLLAQVEESRIKNKKGGLVWID